MYLYVVKFAHETETLATMGTMAPIQVNDKIMQNGSEYNVDSIIHHMDKDWSAKGYPIVHIRKTNWS